MNRVSRTAGLFGSLCLLWSMEGCSFLFVQPLPPPRARGEVLNCTTSRVAPAIDSILTATNMISAAYVASKDDVTNKGEAVGLGLTVAALWMSSAIYGYSKTAECEQAQEEDYEPPAPVPVRSFRRRPPPQVQLTAPPPPRPPGPAPFDATQPPLPPVGAPAGQAPAPGPASAAPVAPSAPAVTAPPPSPARPVSPSGSQRSDDESP